MTQEIIKFNGYSVHIDMCLIGASFDSKHFRYALNAASEARLRRVIGDLEARAGYHSTRIGKLKRRLARLESMNAKLTKLAPEQEPR